MYEPNSCVWGESDQSCFDQRRAAFDPQLDKAYDLQCCHLEKKVLKSVKKQKVGKVLTAFTEVLHSDVDHFVAGGASHFALVLVVASVGAADGRAADAVTVAVAPLRALAARRQPVEGRHALGAVRAVLLLARVLHIWRVYITSPRYAGQETRQLQCEQQDNPLVHTECEVRGPG